MNQTDNRPVIDIEGALRRIGQDMDLYREFVGFYDEDTLALLQRVADAVAARDANRLHASAHSYRGLVANIGGERARELALRLEGIAREEDWDIVDAVYTDFQDEVARLDRELQKYRD